MMRDERLIDLLARLEAAEGPDRFLDADIWATLQGVVLLEFEATDRSGYSISHRGGLRFPDFPGVGNYTASLDAALALVERVLPEWAPAIRQDARPAFGSLWHAMLSRRGERAQVAAWGSTASIALLTALLRCLAEGTHDGASQQ